MLPSNPTEILLAHDRWATQQLLTTCSALSDEQFHQKFDLGWGSLHNTLTHMIEVVGRWGDLLADREFRPLTDPGIPHSLHELQKMLDESHDQFEAAARSHPLDGLVHRIREGKSYAFSRGAVITHAMTHGTHHRAQCLNMLKHLGIKPLPPSSVMEWTRSVEVSQ